MESSCYIYDNQVINPNMIRKSLLIILVDMFIGAAGLAQTPKEKNNKSTGKNTEVQRQRMANYIPLVL